MTQPPKGKNMLKTCATCDKTFLEDVPGDRCACLPMTRPSYTHQFEANAGWRAGWLLGQTISRDGDRGQKVDNPYGNYSFADAAFRGLTAYQEGFPYVPVTTEVP